MKEVSIADLMKEISGLEKQLESKTAEIDSIQKDLEMCIRQRNTAESQYAELCSEKKQWEELAAGQASDIESLRELVADRTKDVQHYDVENKKLLEKLDVAESELEKANHRLELEISEKERVDRLYDEIKIKNANICSSIADLVRKVMQD